MQGDDDTDNLEKKVNRNPENIDKEEPKRFRIKPNLQAQQAIARQIYIPKTFEGKVRREIEDDKERGR